MFRYLACMENNALKYDSPMLAAFAQPGRFRKGNLHGHSDLSDGRLGLAEVCAHYQQAGYDFIAVTDHFRETWGYPIADTRAFRTDAFTTLTGAELHAPRTERGETWHILAVGLPLDFAPPTPRETGPDLARRAAEAGAFVAIAHPHWYQLTIGDGLALNAAHAVEVYNHVSWINSDRGDGMVLFESLLCEGRRLLAIATDDSHFKTPDTGGGWVMVKSEENSPEALLSALKAGHFYSSQGPKIHDIRREGDALEIRCSPTSSILVVGPNSKGERLHGTDLTEGTLPLKKFHGSWCRAIVTDANGKRAWSNPLWLDDPAIP